jgi:hypothetical protein
MLMAQLLHPPAGLVKPATHAGKYPLASPAMSKKVFGLMVIFYCRDTESLR